MLGFVNVSSRFVLVLIAFVMRRLEVQFLSPAPVFSMLYGDSRTRVKMLVGYLWEFSGVIRH